MSIRLRRCGAAVAASRARAAFRHAGAGADIQGGSSRGWCGAVGGQLRGWFRGSVCGWGLPERMNGRMSGSYVGVRLGSHSLGGLC
jgi:hypothetical protein